MNQVQHVPNNDFNEQPMTSMNFNLNQLDRQVLSEAIEKHPAAFKDKMAFLDAVLQFTCALGALRFSDRLPGSCEISRPGTDPVPLIPGSGLCARWLFTAHVGGVPAQWDGVCMGG